MTQPGPTATRSSTLWPRGLDRGDRRLKEHWKNEPEEHDYPAASAFLSLLAPPATVDVMVAALRSAPLTQRKARDLLRAAGLPLLPPDNGSVKRDLEKVGSGVRLSPVLLVRGSLGDGRPLVVADGYHRICASQHLDEDADVPCRIVELH